MKRDMTDIERVVCLQMITCHNMFFVDFLFYENTRFAKENQETR